MFNAKKTIKNLLKIIYENCPKVLADYGLYLFYYFKNKNVLSNNRNVKSTREGIVFLIATGPSLNDEDLDALVGKPCYTVSNVILHPYIQKLNPIGHFIAAYHLPISKDNFIKWLVLIDERLPLSTFIVTDVKNKVIIEDSCLFLTRDVYYLQTYPSKSVINVDASKPIAAPWTVPQLAIPFLIYSGYSEINLIGCDHNSLKNYNDKVDHFYEVQNDARDNASSASVWQNGDIIKYLTMELEMFKLYYSYKKFAEDRSIIISVSGSRSWLDFFEKKSYSRKFGE